MAEIVTTEDVMGGQPHIEGRRISVLQIAEWVHEEGMAPETVSREFDLDLADIYRALAYYYDNTAKMEEWRKRRRRLIEESQEEGPQADSYVETA